MASYVSTVVIQGLHGRRYSLKVTPNTSILQVLEEASKKQGVSPDDYDLKHGSKILDTSLTIRFANIPNNAMLELQPASKLRKEGNVTVGIQLESGERLTGDFSPSCSVWDVVYHCLSQRNGTPNHGDDGSLVPVCIYMREKIPGEEMKNRTLRSLGLTNGTAMFRLLYQQIDRLHEQAHVSSPLSKPITEAVVCESNEKRKTNETADLIINKTPQEQQEERIDMEQHYTLPSPEAGKTETNDMAGVSSFSSEHSLETSCDSGVHVNINLPELANVSTSESNELASRNMNVDQNYSPDNHMDVDQVSADQESTDMEDAGTVTIIGERNAILFNQDDVTSSPKFNPPDDFYDLTVDDVRYLLEEYKRTRLEMENKPLELQSRKQNENIQRLVQYSETVVRIQFPDRLVLQGVFAIDDTVKSVMEFVHGFLENQELHFYLYISPPKTILIPEKTLLESRLFPAALVYFGCEKYLSSYVKSSYKNQLSHPKAANRAAAEFRSKRVANISSDLHDVHIDENVNVEVNSQLDLDSPSTSTSHNLRRIDQSESKAPKWLKFGKK